MPSASIAGGSDEVQHNIIGERALGLPKDSQLDPGTPFLELSSLAANMAYDGEAPGAGVAGEDEALQLAGLARVVAALVGGHGGAGDHLVAPLDEHHAERAGRVSDIAHERRARVCGCAVENECAIVGHCASCVAI